MPSNWRRIADLYAGTGALGIEALSRDAEWVDFVDQSKECCDLIK
ncbi:MAG: 16S rRNA (guanine(966)-N(2))-methyltransferase RsmD, partial [Chloroflexi bacterium]